MTPPDPPAAAGGAAADKRRLRSRLLAARRAAGPPDRAGTDRLAGHLLATPELARLGPGDRVAGYAPLPGEPTPAPVLAVLAARGVQILLPLLRPDGDLDWAMAGASADPETADPESADGGLAAVPGRPWTPTGPALGPDAVRAVAVVLLPGIAGDTTGRRLGRGGGSYDRALARLADSPPAVPATWTCLLLRLGEVLDAVPGEEHDQPVQALATADGVLRTT